MRAFLFLVVVLTTLSTCKDDEVIDFPSCSNGDTYALDYRTAQFSGNTIWLSNSAAELVLDEDVEGGTATRYFVNLEDACSDVYTFSTAGYPNMSNGNPQIFAHNFQINEFGGVPAGSVVDYWNALNSTIFGSLPEGTIYIENCPPIDSVRLLTYADPREGYGLAPRFSFEYSAEDSLLAVHTQLSFLWVTDLQLAVRTLDGVWGGMSFPANALVDLPAPRSYADLQPMELLQTMIEWPTNATDAELEIFWVQDVNNRRLQLIGRTDKPGLLEMPSLSGIDGPFLFQFHWKDDHEREIHRVEESWFPKLSFFPTIEGELVNYQYPQLQYESTGANVITLDGIYDDPNSSAYCRRQYAGPVATDGNLVLAPFSNSLDQASNRLKSLYESTWDQDLTLHFYHYPAMTGNFGWYLRYVVSDLGTGSEWLDRLNYERMTIPAR
mgnify:CR=1 FL=1